MMTQHERREQWRERLASCSSSGMGVGEWCAQHLVSEHQYYRWRRRLAGPPSRPAQEKHTSWVALGVAPDAPASVITVRIGKAVIDVQPGFDPALLRALVSALEASPC